MAMWTYSAKTGSKASWYLTNRHFGRVHLVRAIGEYGRDSKKLIGPRLVVQRFSSCHHCKRHCGVSEGSCRTPYQQCIEPFSAVARQRVGSSHQGGRSIGGKSDVPVLCAPSSDTASRSVGLGDPVVRFNADTALPFSALRQQANVAWSKRLSSECVYAAHGRSKRYCRISQLSQHLTCL
jgi:hypothetical protein